MPVEDYLAGLARELELRFPRHDEWTAETLYLGGGTPSRLGGDGINRLLDLLRHRVSLDRDAEVTLEANPEDVTPANAAAWRQAGVNRLSLGAQSFDDHVLRWMHRTHESDAAARAVDAWRRAGGDNYSLDLIFALPNELEPSWQDELEAALALDPPHVSLYGLTVERGTPLAAWRERGTVTEAPDERYEREYLYAHERMKRAGLEHYEVSNFARPGKRAQHNAAYWSGAPYAGLGPSAHEFDGNTRRWNVRAYAEWQRRLSRGLDPIDGSELLDAANRETEAVYLGLRTDAGLRLTGASLERSRTWLQAGWGTDTTDGRFALTPLGWLRLDSLACDLTAVRSHS